MGIEFTGNILESNGTIMMYCITIIMGYHENIMEYNVIVSSDWYNRNIMRTWDYQGIPHGATMGI